ncbi:MULTISPECIES: YceD family protein [Aerosakkonema]|uniref:YceD family protein n=1 Tax=Aerosakkonema TaxID=1246629 RepID=UPI0035B988B1
MEPIYIPHLLKAPAKKEEIQLEEFLPALETLTPVRGRAIVTHQGNYLEVSVQAEAIITLTCHRCLQQYNHRLVLKTSELIWLDEAADESEDIPSEREVLLEDLVETLPPNGYFNPSDWLYQQMCLAIPQRQLCDSQCPGITIKSEEGQPPPLTDRRWATLEALKKQLS